MYQVKSDIWPEGQCLMLKGCKTGKLTSCFNDVLVTAREDTNLSRYNVLSGKSTGKQLLKIWFARNFSKANL